MIQYKAYKPAAGHSRRWLMQNLNISRHRSDAGFFDGQTAKWLQSQGYTIEPVHRTGRKIISMEDAQARKL